MSKTKTKRARRELKREGQRKMAAYHGKAEKNASTATSSCPTRSHAHPSARKQKAKQADSKPSKPALQASQQQDVPFGTYDRILLVGEGDFSFTRALVVDHGCADVTATSFDTETQVQEKYPAFSTTRQELSSLSSPVPMHHGIDATKLSSYKHLRRRKQDDDYDDHGGGGDDDHDKRSEKEGDDEQERKQHGWDTIVFMFPHTGGLSTDVNRQVRANQALLVSFFTSCLETSTPAKRLQLLQAQAQAQARARGPAAPPFLRMGGKIIVTLFEGEPYTLWNIRDLARHAGLKVVKSWKFDWGQYPSYRHVRTLGTLQGRAAWNGEDRDARMYVFEKIPLLADSDEEREMDRTRGIKRTVGAKKNKQGAAAKKRGREDTSDSESD